MALGSRSFLLSCGALFLACFLIALFVRIRFLEFPLERDEGEYAYAGQLLLQGIPPYQLVYNMKFPGTYVVYAAIIGVFGESASAIHLGLLLINIATILGVFVISRQLANTEAGLLAGAFYAVLSLSPWVAGLCGHATHFVVFPVLIGSAMLLRRRVSSFTTFVAGALFGIAIVIKQPAALFLPFGYVAIVFSINGGWKQAARRIAVFLSGAAAPVALMFLGVVAAGTFARFKYWAIDYASAYATLISPREGLRLLLFQLPQIIGGDWLIWALGFTGVILAAFLRKAWPRREILLALAMCSAAAVCPGFYFREHYFILLLPAIAIAAAATLARMATNTPAQIVAAVIAVIGVALPLYRDRALLFHIAPVTASRFLYWPSPFAEAPRISDFVRDRTNGSDTIAVLGSEPEIYFDAARRSASGYIYSYALMEPHARASEMQSEMISEIERARPKFIIVIGTDPSWLRRPTSDQKIFRWANDYCGANYSVAGLVNLVSPDRTDFFLPLDPSTPAPNLANNYVLVYERRVATAP